WSGTETGIARFDGVKFTTYRTRNTPALRNSLTRSMAADPNGGLWIGHQAGLTHYRDGEFSAIDGITGAVPSIIHSRDGRIWVAEERRGVAVLENGVVHRVDSENTATRMVRAMLEDADGVLWIASRGEGVLRLENDRFVPVPQLAGLPPVLCLG